MKGNKKIVIIGICMLVILSTFSGAEMIDAEIKGRKELIAKENPTEVSSNVTIIYEFHSMAHKNPGKKLNFVNTAHDERESTKIVFEKTLNLSAYELDEILRNIQIEWDKFLLCENPKEKMKIFSGILEMERDCGLLPSSFTLENINKTGMVLSRIFRQIRKNNQLSNPDEGNEKFTTDLFNFGDPFIGFGSAACIIAPYAQILPIAIGMLAFEMESIEIPIFENSVIDFTFVVFLSWMELLICHAAASLGWAISFLPPNAFSWIGPSYSLWGLVGGFSLTIYLHGPPTVTLIDMGLWGGATNIILPFSIGK